MHLFPHRTRLFHLSTENGRSQSVRDGHQSVYSRADAFVCSSTRIFHKWKKEKYFLSCKKGIKKWIWKCMTLININNHHPHVRFINNNSSLVLTLWKRGETSSTTSLLLIRTSSTSGFRNDSVFTSSGSILCSNEEWFRNDSGITTARQSNNSSDVTRLVVTEHVRNKYSLLQSTHLKSVNLCTASV